MSPSDLKPADCCDSNVCRSQRPAVSPQSVTEAENGHGVIARYRCPRCQHTWQTGWGYALLCMEDPWGY